MQWFPLPKAHAHFPAQAEFSWPVCREVLIYHDVPLCVNPGPRYVQLLKGGLVTTEEYRSTTMGESDER